MALLLKLSLVYKNAELLPSFFLRLVLCPVGSLWRVEMGIS